MASSHFCVTQFPRKVLHKQRGVYCILVRYEHRQQTQVWFEQPVGRQNTSGVQERFSLSK